MSAVTDRAKRLFFFSQSLLSSDPLSFQEADSSFSAAFFHFATNFFSLQVLLSGILPFFTSRQNASRQCHTMPSCICELVGLSRICSCFSKSWAIALWTNSYCSWTETQTKSQPSPPFCQNKYLTRLTSVLMKKTKWNKNRPLFGQQSAAASSSLGSTGKH